MPKNKFLKRLEFYLWVGLAWTLLWMFAYLVSEKDSYLLWIINELWRNSYLVMVNFFFYEWAWPIIIKKIKYLI